MRRFGEPPRAGRLYRRRPGTYGILLRAGRVLVTEQTTDIVEVQLPGGGVDPGESPFAALHREVLEETGWTIGPARYVTTYRRFTFMPEYDLLAEKVCAVFLARPSLCLGPPTEAGHRAIWLSVADALGQLDQEGDREALRRVIGGY